MADIADIQLKIKAVEFTLSTFADFENEEERRSFLRQNFTAVSGLKIYFDFTKDELKDEKKQLQEKENMLLAQQKGSNCYT